MSVKEPLNLKELMEFGVVFNVDMDSIQNVEKETEEDHEYKKNVLQYMNLEVAGEQIQDEDTYVEGQPFEIIASKMFKLVGNGNIMKRIIREGYGEKPPDLAIVRVHYHAYIEYQAEPFDSTYARNRVHQFMINGGEVIPGLDIAVQSMKLDEKAQFIIKPELAYGRLGCLNRVPANADVLFEIELLEIVNVGAATSFQKLSEDEQKQFSHVYEYCLALCAKAKDLCKKNRRGAIKEYNMAVGKLEHAVLNNYEDQEKQQELLLRLYSNLLVCYTIEGQHKKGCLNFNKIKEMVKGTSQKISAKCFFNNAKCLRMLGDYELAKKRLDLAHKMEPNNPDILNEMIILDGDIKDYKKKEIQLSKALIDSGK